MPDQSWKPADEQLELLARSLAHFFEDEFDRELSAFQARALIEFCSEQIGAVAYNRGVVETRAAIERKLEDVEAELSVEPPAR